MEAVDGPLDFERFPVGSILALIPFHVSTRPAMSHHIPPHPAQHSSLHRPAPRPPCTPSTTSTLGGRWWSSGTPSVAGREESGELPGCCTHTGVLHPPRLESCTHTVVLHPCQDPAPTPRSFTHPDAALISGFCTPSIQGCCTHTRVLNPPTPGCCTRAQTQHPSWGLTAASCTHTGVLHPHQGAAHSPPPPHSGVLHLFWGAALVLVSHTRVLHPCGVLDPQQAPTPTPRCC